MSQRSTDSKPKRYPKMLTFLVFSGAIVVIVIFFFRFQYLAWDFRNNLWAPAYLLINGQDPFRVYLLFPGTNSLWSPSSVGLFFYLGALPLQVATNLWLLINVMIVIALAFAYWFENRDRILLVLVSLLLIVLSPVTISHLYFGQATLWFVACSLAAAYLLGVKRLGYAGAAFAVGLMKPQLALLVLPGMLVGVWKIQKLRGLVRFAIGFCLVALAGLIPVWIGYPGWLDGYVNAFRINPQWIQPTSFRILQMLLSNWGIALWAALFAVALGLVVHLWAKFPPLTAVTYTFALTTLVSPYLWSYDFVLLIPFFLLTLVQMRGSLYFWLFSLTWMFTSIGGFLIRLRTDNVDLRFAWIPWLVVLTGMFLAYLDRINFRKTRLPREYISES